MKILFWLMLMPWMLFASHQDEQIIVKLETEQQLLPIYIAPIINDQSELPPNYLQELEKVLRFDFENNGSSFIVPPTDQHTSQVGSKCDALPANITWWLSENIGHVIKVSVSQKKLSGNLFLLHNNSVKSIKALPLSGNLNSDRQQIHRLADAFHRALFGFEGIASSRLLYTIKRKSADKWLSNVWECDYDGANAHEIILGQPSYCVTPVYIPPSAGNQPGAFLYVSYKNGQPKIFIAPLKGGSEQRMTMLRGNQLMPAITQKRDKVAFICDAGGNPDLFLQPFSPEEGAIGKPRQIYLTYGATQGSPSFSPDGNSLAFVSNKDGSARIYVMQIPSEKALLKDVKVHLISRANRESSAPAWSPDGSKLAYCAKNGAQRQIWIYDFESDREWQLTKGQQNKENPAWAPDSFHLVYNTSDSGAEDLYMVNLNQRTPLKIPAPPGDKRFPAWQPR